MAGGNKKIHEHPNAGSNDFRKRPQDAGRPPILPDLKEAIARCLAEEKDGLTALDAILRALRARAAKGDVRAAQELMDRGFGKATQIISGAEEALPIEIIIRRNAG